MNQHPDLQQLKDFLRSLQSPLDGLHSETSMSQCDVECRIIKYAACLLESPELDRSHHFYYLFEKSKTLPMSFSSLDASRCWLSFWILHSMDVLGMLDSVRELICHRFTDFLGRCQNPSGGFGGGPQQLSHLAPTYAAVMSISIIGTDAALSLVNRKTMKSFLLSMKNEDGSFQMHKDGESDIRATYCALAVASILHLMDDDLLRNVETYVHSCQTYEGGFGGEPFNEAHGGYTFCGLACLIIIERESVIDIDRLIHWSVSRQMPVEGGFQGRTNKLVDGCYSYWVGALFPLILGTLKKYDLHVSESLYLEDRLQSYLLHYCQDHKGGMLDKPGKYPDPYHTCYCLSGLSVSQYGVNDNPRCIGESESLANMVYPLNYVYNIRRQRFENANRFYSKPLPEIPEPSSSGTCSIPFAVNMD